MGPSSSTTAGRQAGGTLPSERGDGAVARPRWYSHGWNRVAYYRAATALAASLPRSARLGLARAAGRRLGGRFPAERAAVRANLRRVLPEATPARLDAAVGETFAAFAACFADLLTLNRRPAGTLRRWVSSATGEDHLEAALAADRGVILLTAHLGNWELGGRLLGPRLGRATHVVLSAEQDATLETYLRTDTPGLHFVTRRHATSTLGLLAALRRREAVALQGDRPTGERGDTLVPFFGEPAAFPLGPFVLARAAGAPVVPAFCTMDAEARYRISIEPAIWVRRGEEAEALARMVGALERAVRAAPTQWFNFFDVWPPGPPGVER
jgi:KDO2-lipid IV(A) lauroyltransferase